MTDIIGRLLDEAEKAQRKGHLVLAEVCRDASDQLGLITEERDRLRAGLMREEREANAAVALGLRDAWRNGHGQRNGVAYAEAIAAAIRARGDATKDTGRLNDCGGSDSCCQGPCKARY